MPLIEKPDNPVGLKATVFNPLSHKVKASFYVISNCVRVFNGPEDLIPQLGGDFLIRIKEEYPVITGLADRIIFLGRKIVKCTLICLYLVKAPGDLYSLIGTVGIDNDDLIGKRQAFKKALHAFGFVKCNSQCRNGNGIFQEGPIVCVKVIILPLKKYLDMIKRLPVLLYHAVAPAASQGLTIGVQQLEEQFNWLARNGYRSWHFSDLTGGQKLNGQKNVMITFDDGYVNQMEHAVPLLQKYGLRATFFIPLKYIGQKDMWNTNQLEIMDLEQLRSLDPKLVELGCHSFSHLNFRDAGLEAADSDIAKACLCINEAGLRFSPVLAYPYGKFPRKQPQKNTFFELLEKQGFLYALRIGNRVNHYPFKSPYEIQRLDIKGEYSLSRFKRKVLFGKWP